MNQYRVPPASGVGCQHAGKTQVKQLLSPKVGDTPVHGALLRKPLTTQVHGKLTSHCGCYCLPSVYRGTSGCISAESRVRGYALWRCDVAPGARL